MKLFLKTASSVSRCTRSATTSYLKGRDFTPWENTTLNDVLIHACEKRPDANMGNKLILLIIKKKLLIKNLFNRRFAFI